MCSPKLGEEYFGHSLSELTLSQVHEEAQLFMFNAVLPTTDKAHQGFTLTYETRVGGVSCQEIITAHLDLTNDRMWSMLKARHSHLYIKLKADPLVLDLLRNQGKPLSDIKKTKAAAMLNGIERMAVACQSQMTDDADYVPRVVEQGGGKGRPPLPPPRQRSRSRSQSRARADDDDGDEEYDECDEGDDDDDAADDDEARSSDGGARGRGRGRSGGGRARAGRRGSSAARARGGRVKGGGGGGGSSGADDDSATENNSAERIEVAAWNKALLDNDNDATAALDSPEIRRIHKRPSLREKCIKSGVKLRNVGDDGHGIINPRFFLVRRLSPAAGSAPRKAQQPEGAFEQAPSAARRSAGRHEAAEQHGRHQLGVLAVGNGRLRCHGAQVQRFRMEARVCTGAGRRAVRFPRGCFCSRPQSPDSDSDRRCRRRRRPARVVCSCGC